MARGNIARRRGGGAHSIVLLTLLLAGCGSGGPAPVVNGGGSPSAPIVGQMVIQPGQTLSGIAHHYHVPMQAIAEANHLSPPYRILAGASLIIPGGGGGLAGAPEGPVAMGPAAPVAMAPVSPPPPEVATNLPASPDGAVDRPIPLDHPDHPVPAAPRPEIASPEPANQPGERALPPGPPPGQPTATLTPPPPAMPTRSAASAASSEPPAARPPAAPGAMVAAAPPPAAPVPGSATHRGGSFLWPVRGHVLEDYGAGPDGTHNDGINIAAPRGAPVQATDAGVVAYAGNELRGYGNLILIKHPNGWISAYAHCDLILVRTGQKVARGQVIARVGSTGNVSAPQLHFELRRGKHPVDPRDYLTPLPSAAARQGHAS